MVAAVASCAPSSSGTVRAHLTVFRCTQAREQDVLAQVTNKLAHIIPANNLTVQVIKDDWMGAAHLGTPSSTPSRSVAPWYHP